MAPETRSQPLPRRLRNLFLLGMGAWVIGFIIKVLVLVRLWQTIAVMLMGSGSLLLLAGLAALAVASMRVRGRMRRYSGASRLWLVVLLAAYLCYAVAFVMGSFIFILAPAPAGWIVSTLYLSLAAGTVLFAVANIPLLRLLWRLARAAR